MNLWFRLLHLLLCSLFRPKLEAPFGVSRLQFRVLPNDLDSNLHMTNGRYWNIFDLGRLDLILRMGLGKVALREKWAPIVGAGTIQFRRELKPFQRFTLETRLAGWVGTRLTDTLLALGTQWPGAAMPLLAVCVVLPARRLASSACCSSQAARSSGVMAPESAFQPPARRKAQKDRSAKSGSISWPPCRPQGCGPFHPVAPARLPRHGE